MSAFTQKNLTEVEDSAAKFDYEELMEVRFANDDLETGEAGVS